MLLDLREIGVAGYQRRLAVYSQGGSEAIGVGELVIGFEFGGNASEGVIGVDERDGKLGDVGEDF